MITTALGKQYWLDSLKGEKDLVRRKDRNKHVLSKVYTRTITYVISFQHHMLHVICGAGKESEAGRAKTVEDLLLSTRHGDITRKSGLLCQPH